MPPQATNRDNVRAGAESRPHGGRQREKRSTRNGISTRKLLELGKLELVGGWFFRRLGNVGITEQPTKV